MDQEDGVKIRNFRNGDYSSRRVFLRSYPLQWEEEEEEEEEEREEEGSKESLKSRFIAIIEWGEGKVLLLRRIKNKVSFYVVGCYRFGFNSSNKMLTA